MEVRRMAGRMQWRTCLVFILVSFAVLCGAQQSQNFTLTDPPSDLMVDSSGTVFVAAGNELFRLGSDFDQQESMELAMSPTTIQRIALSQDGSRVVVCLDDESCAVYNASNIVAGAQLTREDATAGATAGVTVFTSPSDSFYTGSYGSTGLGARNVIYLTQYGFGGSEFSQNIPTTYNGNAVSLVRTFYGGFVAGTNAYYIVYDGGANDVRGIRVLRICDQGPCPGGAGSCVIDALYEAQLDCGAVGTSSTICGVSLLDAFDGTPQSRLVVSLCDRNRICSYNLTQIDATMDSLYTQCSTGTGTVPQPVWIGGADLPCSGFESDNECSGFQSPSALTTSAISGTVHVNLGTAVESLSSTLALTVDGSTLLYVGYTVGVQHFVGRYHIRSDLTNAPLSGATVVAQPTSPVSHLQWVEEMEYIYVATGGDSSDENNIIAPVVFRIPVEQCSTFTDCQSCTADTNPLCGWCTVEDKCSRRSECRNSSEPMRWVQETSECISSEADPMTFVLDNPQNITVTVTPGLPPPLDGESYECYFTAADGTPFSTDALEVMTNTTYVCNITEVVPDFQGASLVTDFSFRSTAVGIPFATEEGEVTVYNCPEASSCSECLQTQNACGWCIYNKRCSGTPEPCLNSNETFFLSPGVGQTFEDICPLLEPGPFSGEYVQPVAIERNITLITSNLPEPITGFSYGCMIGDVALSVEYIDETSFTCIVEGNQLSLLSGDNDGRDRVPVRIVWRSDDGMVVHNIDTRNGATINTLLYDCTEVASTCSACLASSIGTGLECAWLNSGSCVLNTTAGTTDNPLQCPDPVITGISPTIGPLEGGTTITITGTDLGTMFSDVDGNVTISGQLCDTTGQEAGYVPGLAIVCETPNLGDTNDFTIMVTLLRASGLVNAPSPVPFTAITPNVTGVEPDLGPVTGGTILRVMGTNLGIGNVEDTSVTVGGENCTVQNPSNDISETEIRCTTAAFTGDSSQCNVDPQSNGTCPSFSNSVVVVVSVDDFTSQPGSTSFDYRCEPTFSSVSPTDIIPAGGIRLTFSGCNLIVLQQPSLVLTGSRRRQTGLGSCSVTNATSIVCIAPTSSPSAAAPGIIVMNAAGPDIPVEDLQLNVVANPSFPTGFDQEYTEESGSSIQIPGTDLTNVGQSEYQVTIGGQPCPIIARTQELLCTPPQLAPGGQNEAPVMVFVGQNLNFSVGTLTYVTDDSGVPVRTIAIAVGASGGGVLILSVFVICIILCVYSSKSREKDKRLTNLLSQMELWELEMADECKRAFTELQTDLADLVQISAADKNLPYRDFRSFAMRFLFPSADHTHPVLQPLALPDGVDREAVSRQLASFRDLIMDKKFLLVFVRTLEAQQGSFTLQDKCNVASLLMVAFQNDLDYASEILLTLLTELMRKTVTKSHPKLLLRRTESIAEKMLANWLCFLLFPYLLEHAGEPLFILYRAIKQQLEKGPVDIITGEARHSLSEEKLLRQHLDVKIVEGVVETDGGEEIPIKLLDCDSITQSKEKILDAIYKNVPVSRRPQLTSVDLELRRANAGIPLRDQDQTNTKDGEWIRVNTLGHYRLAEMSQAWVENKKNPQPRFKLVQRPERPLSGMSFDTLGTIIANMNTSGRASLLATNELSHVYHLVKPETGDQGEEGPRQGAKIMSEVFLTRLLSTKRILQPYVDDLFRAIFAVPRGKPLPKAVKYLFDFLDLQAAELGIQDPEILHTWKTNSLPLRFWVNLIKNPDFVFDINKSATVDACLTVIAQAYIDGCSTTELHYTKETPSARLLYVNEVKSYKNEVQQYYDTIQSLPKLDGHEMQEYLRETAQVCASSVPAGAENDVKATTRQLYFQPESALFELFQFAAEYHQDISDALNEDGLALLCVSFGQTHQALTKAGCVKS